MATPFLLLRGQWACPVGSCFSECQILHVCAALGKEHADDILPYVPMLMPELQKALIDPLPEVRAMAARAMGSLMQVCTQSAAAATVCVCVFVCPALPYGAHCY
eukprot:1141834-Pelagomonas_calceolata.AAC.1